MSGGGVVVLSAKDLLPLLSILNRQELVQPAEVKPIVVTPTTFEPSDQLPPQAQPDAAKNSLTAKEMLAALRPPSPNFGGSSARDQDLLAALRTLSKTQASAADTANENLPMRQSMKQIVQRAAMILEWSAALSRRPAVPPGSELSQAQQMKSAAAMLSSTNSAPQEKQVSQTPQQAEATAKSTSSSMAQAAGAQAAKAPVAAPPTVPNHAAASTMQQVADQISQAASIRERSISDLHLPHSASMAVPADMELPVILNAGMLPVWMGVTQLKGPMTPGMFLKLDDEQILKYLLSMGVKETLLQKFKRLFKKAKKSNKMMVSFFSIFTALNIVADRVIEELSAFMNEEDEVMDRLAHADLLCVDDERHRVYLG